MPFYYNGCIILQIVEFEVDNNVFFKKIKRNEGFSFKVRFLNFIFYFLAGLP